MRSRFHELAATELEESLRYYDTKVEGLGDTLLSEVHAAVVHIENFPQGSPAIERNVRRKVLAKFPYNLFYTVTADEVIILSVAHESRRPGFWRGRLV